MSVRSSVIRCFTLAVLMSSLGGCKTWEPAAAAPGRVIADTRPPSVRVTRADGIRITLENPIFVNDSLVSGAPPPPGMIVVPPRPGIAAEDVSLVEVARFSPSRTIALAAAIAGVSITWARIQGDGLGGQEREGPLPKDPALDLVAVFRLVWGSLR